MLQMNDFPTFNVNTQVYAIPFHVSLCRKAEGHWMNIVPVLSYHFVFGQYFLNKKAKNL